MRILFSVHLYPPTHNCGGEYYLHNMAKWLITRGHEIRVLLHQGSKYGITEIYDYEGVTVFPVRMDMGLRAGNLEIELFNWCTHAITHLEYTGLTINMCRITKKPCIQVVHNDTPYDVVLCSFKDLNIIYNSQWIADKLNYQHRSMVLTPPVDWHYYDQGVEDPYKNEYITLINGNRNKGGRQFEKIARALPNKKFLLVKGSYEHQYLPDLPNVAIMDNTRDIRPVYKMTRLLLMPSKYESWGMTASEAMANGIPVICNPTPGLMENTAGKMVYCDWYKIGDWVDEIKAMDNRMRYTKYSNAGRQRARELDPIEGYKKLEEFLYVAV